jgi:hypothetical protein
MNNEYERAQDQRTMTPLDYNRKHFPDTVARVEALAERLSVTEFILCPVSPIPTSGQAGGDGK